MDGWDYSNLCPFHFIVISELMYGAIALLSSVFMYLGVVSVSFSSKLSFEFSAFMNGMYTLFFKFSFSVFVSVSGRDMNLSVDGCSK